MEILSSASRQLCRKQTINSSSLAVGNFLFILCFENTPIELASVRYIY